MCKQVEREQFSSRSEMKFRRRHFLQWGLTQVTAAAVLANQAKASDSSELPVRQGLSMMQGATDETTTQFSVLHLRSQNLKFYIKNKQNTQIFPFQMKVVQSANHPYQLTKLIVQGLNPKETYVIQVVDQSQSQLIDTREFKTLNVDREDLAIAMCTCMDDEKHDPMMWQNMMRQRPDLLIFLGDCAYANRGANKGMADAAHLWKMFCQARLTLEIYYTPVLVPIVATWDDHDFGMNNGDAQEFPFVLESQQNFLNFFAQEPGVCRNMFVGPGVSSAWKFGSNLFFLLDNRSFRERNESTGRYAHWGREQEEWMMSLIRQHTGPTFICSGSVFFLEMMMVESLSKCHPGQFRGFLSELRSVASKVVFVSGDVHFSEVSRIEPEILGYTTYELTSSSIHSVVLPGILSLISNPRRVVATSQRNYILFRPSANGYGCSLNATSFGKNGQVLFQKVLDVK